MTGRGNRIKGNTAERQAVDYLRANGFPHAERKGAGLPGADIAELGPGLEIEIKNRRSMDLAGYVDQLEQAMADSGAEMGAVIVKRPGTADRVGEWYGVLPARLLVQLLREAGYGDEVTT